MWGWWCGPGLSLPTCVRAGWGAEDLVSRSGCCAPASAPRLLHPGFRTPAPAPGRGWSRDLFAFGPPPICPVRSLDVLGQWRPQCRDSARGARRARCGQEQQTAAGGRGGSCRTWLRLQRVPLHWQIFELTSIRSLRATPWPLSGGPSFVCWPTGAWISIHPQSKRCTCSGPPLRQGDTAVHRAT